MSPEKISLSVAIITKDEEKNLPACLASVSFAGDIVVVDSGSMDETVGIARKFGCRVFVEDWRGYGPQKNSAVSKCRHTWVLVLDADERVPQNTRDEIMRTIGAAPHDDAFRLKRKNFLHGRWLKHSGYWPDRQIRLVNKDRGSFQNVIHEKWVTSGMVGDLDGYIEHYAFDGYSDMLKTLNDYSTVIAAQLYAAGRKTHVLSPPWHGIGMFFKIYFLKRGFLDGMDGLVTALTKAGGSFFKYAKLLELQREKR
jgi:glycosyltransferase involved in cell wall biosynthesis